MLPPRSTLTDPLFPYPTLFRSPIAGIDLAFDAQRHAADTIDVGDGRAAEFLHDQGHEDIRPGEGPPRTPAAIRRGGVFPMLRLSPEGGCNIFARPTGGKPGSRLIR